MHCVDNIEKLIKDEIKFNVKVCNIKPDWMKDKTIIALDSNFKLYDIFQHGYHNLTQIRRNKEINYLIFKHTVGIMYLSDTRLDHHLGAYRSRQTAIWDHFYDVNKLSNEWWINHLIHYGKKHNRYRKHLLTAQNYLDDLTPWIVRAETANHCTPETLASYKSMQAVLVKTIESLKEQEVENTEQLHRPTDSNAE